MKNTGAILSLLGVGLLATGIILLIKKTKKESSSNLIGGGVSSLKQKQKCPKGYYLSKGICYPNPETSTHTKSLYE